MQNNSETKVIRTKPIMDLRRKIYLLESANLHKKVPQNDKEMVEKIIKEIKIAVDKEEAK